MYDELTRQDIQKMQEEIDYRVQVLRPKLIEDVQTARAFGDLSENFEYKCAKQEKNRNDSRIRYLQRMIKTARVIEDHSRADTAGLYDTVEILMENTGDERDPLPLQPAICPNPLPIASNDKGFDRALNPGQFQASIARFIAPLGQLIQCGNVIRGKHRFRRPTPLNGIVVDTHHKVGNTLGQIQFVKG